MFRFFLWCWMVTFSLGCTLLGGKEEVSHPHKMSGFYLSGSQIKAGLPHGFQRLNHVEEEQSNKELLQITQAILSQIETDATHVDQFADSTGIGRWLIFVNAPQREVSKVTTALDNLGVESFMQQLAKQMEPWTLHRRGSTFRTKRHLEYAKYKHLLEHAADTVYVTRFVTNVSDRTCTIFDINRSEEDFESLLSTLTFDK